MARITGEIFIDRPVDAVFDFVVDETNEPMYNAELLRSEKVTDGPIGVGTQFKALHTSRGRPVEMLVEVKEYVRPQHMSSTTTMPHMDVTGALTFEQAGPGTRMRWSWDVRPKGLTKILTPLVGLIGRRQERACWEGLKRYLETEPAATTDR